MALVSVILPVYNSERFLHEAVDSILNQTLADFELLILDDGSEDGSAAILAGYARHDARIRLFSNPANLGLPRTLNRGLDLAQGKYLARMDADDISLPNRLEKQVAFLDAHPQIAVVGAWASIIGGKPGAVWRPPLAHDAIYARMLFENALIHPSIMLRRAVFLERQLRYSPQARHVEDYELWSRVLPQLQFANLPEILLHYRLHAKNTAKRHPAAQNLGRAALYRHLMLQLGLEPDAAELNLHAEISRYAVQPDRPALEGVRHWLEKLLAANRRAKRIAPEALQMEIGHRWAQICRQAPLEKRAILALVLASSLPFGRRSGMLKWPYLFISLLRSPK